MLLTSSSGEIIHISDVNRLGLQRGDKILVTTLQPLSKESRKRVIAFFQEMFPGHSCIIADSGAKVEVVHEENPGIGPSETFDETSL